MLRKLIPEFSKSNYLVGIILVCLIGLITNLEAQNRAILLDAETGLPVQGASISISANGSQVITYSDTLGIFRFNAEQATEIKIKCLGYETQHFQFFHKKYPTTIFLYPSSLQLSEIKINAALLEKQYLDVSGGINHISRKEIREEKTVSAAEILMDVPGLYMQQGTYTTNKLVIRGIGSRASYGTNRIKAYLDDIPLTSGEGITSFEDLDLLSLAKVEILKGATSAIYGSGLGGTMRLYSDSPTLEGNHASLHTSLGSFGMYKNTISASHKSEDSYVNALYSNTTADGYRQNNRYIRNNAMLKSETSLKKSTVTFLANYIDINGQIPSSLNKEMFENTPEAAAPNWLAVEGYEAYRKILGGITIKTPMSNSLLNHFSLSGNIYNGYERRPFNILDDNSTRFGLRQRLGWKKSKFEITGGLEYFMEKYKWQLYETINTGKGDKFADNKETRFNLNTFLLGNYTITPKLKFDAGLSLNFYSYQIKDNFNSGSNNQSGNFVGAPIFSPRAGLVYSIDTQNAIYTNMGHGFSIPSVEESLLPEGSINTNLKPEEGITYELGLRGDLRFLKLQYDLGAYFTNVSNMLVTKRLTEADFMSINAGKTEHKGVELWLSKNISVTTDFSLFLSGTYSISSHHFLDFVDDGNNYSGNNMPGIPNQQVNFKAEAWYKRKIFLTGRISATGRQFINDSNTEEYNEFNTLDIVAGYRHRWKNGILLSIKAEVENLFNTQYASMLLINAPQFGNNAPRYYYPGLPRNFFLTLSISK